MPFFWLRVLLFFYQYSRNWLVILYIPLILPVRGRDLFDSPNSNLDWKTSLWPAMPEKISGWLVMTSPGFQPIRKLKAGNDLQLRGRFFWFPWCRGDQKHNLLWLTVSILVGVPEHLCKVQFIAQMHSIGTDTNTSVGIGATLDFTILLKPTMGVE